MFNHFVVTWVATFLGLNAKHCAGRACGFSAIISLLFWTLPFVWRIFDTRDVSECGLTPAACKFMSETGQCTTQYWYNEWIIVTRLPRAATSPPVTRPHLHQIVQEETCVLTWLGLWPASRVPVDVGCGRVPSWHLKQWADFSEFNRNECYAIGGRPILPVFNCVMLHVCRAKLWDASQANAI
jgi:hypothetical protein